ncbi:MAG: DEAD/DEAH box helicase [Actinomycetota bacterium]
MAVWPTPNRLLEQKIEDQFRAALSAYEADPKLLIEHFRQEESFRTGGYSDRQISELVQNSADAVLKGNGDGRIEIILIGGVLYCANQGAPFDLGGVDTVTHAYLSSKRGDEIGRFGLGFKSILSLSDHPQVFSRSVSFEFNSERTRTELEARRKDYSGEVPRFRAPTVLDAEIEFEEDDVLAELAKWATTIVKIPVEHDDSSLIEQLESFNAEFLLFAESVNEIAISIHYYNEETDSVEPEAWSFTLRESDTPNRYFLKHSKGSEVEWLKEDQVFSVDEKYRRELGESRFRKTMRISYAAPLSGHVGVGRFWSYFPLQDKTSVSGILNAPWSVNDDRTTILHSSEFNRFLLEKFAALFVGSLHHFSTEEDPARHFDYLPSRAREVDNDADLLLSRRVPELARSAGIIPDLNGTFRHSGDLETLEIGMSVSPQSRETWAKSPSTPRNSPHPRCFATRTRSARFEDLASVEDTNGKTRLDVKQVGIATWLTQLGQSEDRSQTFEALRILDSNTTFAVRDAALMASIIPLSGGGWARVNESTDVLLPPESESATELGGQNEFRFVDHGLLEIEGAQGLLRKLGFAPVDPARAFRILLERAESSIEDPDSDEKWAEAWRSAEDVRRNSLLAIVQDHVKAGRSLRLRSQAGTWERPEDLFDTEALDFEYLAPRNRLEIDDTFGQLSRIVGVIDRVSDDFDFSEDELRNEYFDHAATEYRATKSIARFIDSDDLSVQVLSVPGPLVPLKHLAAHGRSDSLLRWSEDLLRSRCESTWQFDTKSRDGRVAIDAPHIWALKKWGTIETAWGPRSAGSALSPTMVEFAEFLPVAKSSNARGLDLIDDLDDVPAEIWEEFLTRDSSVVVDHRRMTKVVALNVRAHAALAGTGRENGTVLAAKEGRFRTVPGDQVFIATEDQELRMLEDHGHPYLVVSDPDSEATLSRNVGARRASEAFSISTIIDGQDEPATLGDMFSGARGTCRPANLKSQITICRSIIKRRRTPDGTTDLNQSLLMDDGMLYALDTVPHEQLLTAFAREHEIAEPSTWSARVIARTEEHQRSELVDRVRSCHNDIERLRLLFDDATLQHNLPKGLLEALSESGADVSGHNLAEIYFHAVGTRALEDRKEELAERGLNVPRDWAGSDAAVTFVSQLGFDKSFAGESTVRSPAFEVVLGRPELNDLHDYQQEAKRELMRVLRRGITDEGSSKAMIELPTGSGKTRVAVESAVGCFLDEVDPLHGPVLWIAQSEELCEQAVETWNEIWRARADNRPLTINRLWANREVPRPNTELSVVIATDAKLELALEKPEYAWLRDPSAVFVDEAHKAADSPRYGRLLRQLGLDRGKDSRPLIGLSATPFKGTNPRATQSLAARFGKNLVRTLGDDPIRELQRRRILARVRRETLEGGRVAMEAAGGGKLAALRTISKDSLNSLGENVDRNLRIVDHISSLDPDWPVLVFTPSVASAHVVAALLKAREIEAKAVSGQTPRGERTRIISEFRKGSIQVLTNCDVLTHGFDAPRVRALYVAKPTLSPGVYMQMVGRGLRGVENGGSEECLIVDIEDTVDNVAYDLAYREFEHAWSSSSDEVDREYSDVD